MAKIVFGCRLISEAVKKQSHLQFKILVWFDFLFQSTTRLTLKHVKGHKALKHVKNIFGDIFLGRTRLTLKCVKKHT